MGKIHDKEDIFIPVTAKCPVCGRDGSHRYLKSKLYQPVEIEDDQHVVTYRFENPRFENVRPNFYHIWHCRSCHFCDQKEVFRGEDTSRGKLELLRERYLIISRTPNSLPGRLGAAANLEQEFVTLESALTAHLLAIYIQEILSVNMRQYAKLASFYLRVAWLYREKATWQTPEAVPAGYATFADFLTSFRKEWPGLPMTEEEAMTKAIEGYQTDLDTSGRVDDVKYELTVMFLLTDLHRRMGHLDEAVRFVRSIFRNATGRRQGLRQALDKSVHRGASQQQIESLKSLVTWLNNAVDRSKALSDTLLDQVFRAEYPRAREVILTLSEPTVKDVVALLQSQGFHEITCKRVALLFAKKRMTEHAAEPGEAAASETTEEPKEEGKGGFWGNILNKFSSGENKE